MQEHPPVQEVEVGVVTHYWGQIGVAGVHLEAPLNAGDHIHVVGHTADFEQDVSSIQIDHQPVAHAEPGVDVGIGVADRVHEHDRVFKRA